MNVEGVILCCTVNIWPTGIVTEGPKMYPEIISANTQ